ncbi:hypothetical protein HDV57DRAFT_484936 [Trichoderma longibrachiatum]|uniref:Uncharacterized protein n=1 Tax=Trichoderma longibrachiatum ATCC 18648 TaxID=983965 RepID=A0A2T4CD79_TRILO|nr:hypothetical protein M440DRAFT_1398766 [Trichoderma longibrachiatum ATCC 18648]
MDGGVLESPLQRDVVSDGCRDWGGAHGGGQILVGRAVTAYIAFYPFCGFIKGDKAWQMEIAESIVPCSRNGGTERSWQHHCTRYWTMQRQLSKRDNRGCRSH